MGLMVLDINLSSEIDRMNQGHTWSKVLSDGVLCFKRFTMVRLLGKPGKFSGSPSGRGDFEQEFYLTNSEAATLLRDFAQEIEAGGRIEASADVWSLGVNLMPPIKLEVQYKPGKRELEIQIKLRETP